MSRSWKLRIRSCETPANLDENNQAGSHERACLNCIELRLLLSNRGIQAIVIVVFVS
jgi:hypothetical protein